MAVESKVTTVALRAADGSMAPAEVVAALVACADRLATRPGHMIIATGTRSEDVYIVVSGEVRITIFSADGREVIMRDQGPGSFFGDLSAIDGGRRSTSVIAVTRGELLGVRGSDFRAQMFASPAAAEWFTRHLVHQVRSLTERVLELSTLNVRSRLHCHLLRLCAVAGVVENGSVIDPLPTHEVLATMIGTHREAVTRELSYLASMGIVAQSRRRLEIRDVERLANMVRHASGLSER